MKLKLERIAFKEDYTIGKLYIDGVYFCDTLEDAVRPVKIKGRTAIPVGIYRVILNMSNRFKKILPLLLNVLNFAGVRIHSGNTHLDTEGCILVGENKAVGKVLNSRKTMERLMDILWDSNDISIEIC